MKRIINPVSNFKSESAKIVFMDLCKRCPKVTVDWDKFRELDKTGTFSNFTNAQLSLKHRVLKLKEEGLCWYCGEKKGVAVNGCCLECNEKVKVANDNYNSRRKKS